MGEIKHVTGGGYRTLGSETTYLALSRRGEQQRHWVFGDSWSISATSRGRHHRAILKGWWHLGNTSITRHFEIGVALGGEDNMLQAEIVMPWLGRAAIGVRVPCKLTRRWVYERREWALRCGHGRAWWELLVARDEAMRDMSTYYRRKLADGSYDGPWSCAALWPGWQLSLRSALRDRLLGRVVCTTVEGELLPVLVPMPEGNYPGTARREVRVWQRKRWPFSRRERVGWWVDMEVAPPVPDKGENSWDCEDDSIWGTGGPTLVEAIANVTRAALRGRERYGNGAQWVPTAGWPEGIAR